MLCLAPVNLGEYVSGRDSDCDSKEIHGVADNHSIFPKEHRGKQDVDGKSCAAGHKGGDQYGLEPVLGVFQRPGRHDCRDGASKPDQQGKECAPGKAEPAHYVVHYESDPRHISAVLKQCKSQKEDEYIRQEGQDPADAGNDPVNNQRPEHRAYTQGRKSVPEQSQNILSASLRW